MSNLVRDGFVYVARLLGQEYKLLSALISPLEGCLPNPPSSHTKAKVKLSQKFRKAVKLANDSIFKFLYHALLRKTSKKPETESRISGGESAGGEDSGRLEGSTFFAERIPHTQQSPMKVPAVPEKNGVPLPRYVTATLRFDASTKKSSTRLLKLTGKGRSTVIGAR